MFLDANLWSWEGGVHALQASMFLDANSVFQEDGVHARNAGMFLNVNLVSPKAFGPASLVLFYF